MTWDRGRRATAGTPRRRSPRRRDVVLRRGGDALRVRPLLPAAEPDPRRRRGPRALPAPRGRRSRRRYTVPPTAAPTSGWTTRSSPPRAPAARQHRRVGGDRGAQRRPHHRRARDVPDLAGQAFGAGHESAGVTEPATQWLLAEGSTGHFFDIFVLVANPARGRRGGGAYLLSDGTVIAKGYTGRGHQPLQHLGELRGPAPGRRGRLDGRHRDQRRANHRRAGDVVAGATSATWYEGHNSPGTT